MWKFIGWTIIGIMIVTLLLFIIGAVYFYAGGNVHN